MFFVSFRLIFFLSFQVSIVGRRSKAHEVKKQNKAGRHMRDGAQRDCGRVSELAVL